MRALAEWLSGTAPSVAIQSTFWFIRLLQATHLLTAGVVAGAAAMIVLRVLGWQRNDESFDAVWRRFSPWLTSSLAVMVATGIAQTLGDPVREFTSFSYWLKLVVLLLCVTGTALLARKAGRVPTAARLSVAARLMAIALLLAWLALPLLGRMIAYDRAIWGGLSMRT